LDAVAAQLFRIAAGRNRLEQQFPPKLFAKSYNTLVATKDDHPS